jgi:hypothetical protein
VALIFIDIKYMSMIAKVIQIGVHSAESEINFFVLRSLFAKAKHPYMKSSFCRRIEFVVYSYR